jgi:hypothetical protein
MEGSLMLMDQQNQQRENGHTNKSNLHVQYNSYQNPKDIPHKDRKINPKTHMETQKTINSKNNPEQNLQNWRCHNSCLQTTLQSYSNNISMVLAQKQTRRPLGQSRRIRLKSTHLQPTDL